MRVCVGGALCRRWCAAETGNQPSRWPCWTCRGGWNRVRRGWIHGPRGGFAVLGGGFAVGGIASAGG
eukprot:841349-Prorocentrum_minimum.AAC.4